MNPQNIRELLERVGRQECTVHEALKVLRDLPFEDLGFARLDHHRSLRTGVPEIVFGEGKEVDQLLAVVRRLIDRGGPVLVSRLKEEKGERLRREFPEGVYSREARLFFLQQSTTATESPPPQGEILVLAAGTSDIPVAEEARVTAEVLGNRVGRRYDVGVAGLHRLISELPEIRRASVIIAIAGMEGALPSVVAGLVARPVIAVPTSVGYGTNMAGLTPLFAMLNSCVPGVTVVNIDNGVGAAVAAHLMNHVPFPT